MIEELRNNAVELIGGELMVIAAGVGLYLKQRLKMRPKTVENANLVADKIILERRLEDQEKETLRWKAEADIYKARLDECRDSQPS